MKTEHLIELVSRYRSKLLIAGLVIVVTAVLGLVGVGFALYKATTLASDKAKEWQPVAGEVLTQLPERTSGVVEDVVLSFATVWLQQIGSMQDAANVQRGLACFDAIGGPSPSQIVAHAQSSLGSLEVSDGLGKLAALIEASPGEQGPQSCVSWIFNG